MMNPQIFQSPPVWLEFFAWPAFMGLHMVPRGLRWCNYRAGPLLQTVSQPGMHVMFPLITSVRHVQVKNVPRNIWRSSDLLRADRSCHILDMESAHTVVKKFSVDYDRTLIYKNPSRVESFCSVNTLQDVGPCKRTSPRWLPASQSWPSASPSRRSRRRCAKNYESMEAEKTPADDRQMSGSKLAETERKKAVINAEKAAQISRIEWEMKITQKESEKKISEIEDQAALARSRSHSDAELYRAKQATDSEFYRLQKEAEGNKLRLTPEFLEYTRLLALFNNTKIYFGQSIPTMLSENVMLFRWGRKGRSRRHRWRSGSRDLVCNCS
uniref:PHB domain-containing protein n=1 Tax=Macrostomum lignano TaxID=282301 RepID=A0A1I8FGC5_9PLAT